MRFALVVGIGVSVAVSGCHGIRSVSPRALVAHGDELRRGDEANVDDVTVEPFQDVEVVYADGGTHRISVSQLLHDCPAGREMQTAGCPLAGSTKVIVQRGNSGRVAVFVAIVVAVVVATVAFAVSGDAP